MTLAVGQRYLHRKQARQLARHGRPVESAAVEVLGVDYAAGKVQVLLPNGRRSKRSLRVLLEDCELLAAPEPEIEWRGIGGSQAAAAVGDHPYCPPIQVWGELVGELPPFEGNERTKWGKLLEDPIRCEYAQRNDVKVLWSSQPDYHPEHPWARMTPDGIVPGSHGVEIKTVGHHSAHRWGDDGSDEVPQEYRIQCAWYMWGYDLGRWDLAALIGGYDYREYTLERDLHFERVLVPAVEFFWHEYVEKREPPDIDGSTAYTEYLARKHEFKRDVYLASTAETLELADALRQVLADKVAIAEREALLKNQLCTHIGDAAGIQFADGRVSWKPVAGRVSWKPVVAELAARAGVDKAELAALAEQHRGEGYRRFNRPKAWGSK